MRKIVLIFYAMLRRWQDWQLFHDCTVFMHYAGETKHYPDGHKQCIQCGKVKPLFDIAIKHQR